MSETSSAEPAKQRQGIQSIEVGTRLLRALVAGRRAMMLRDIARNAGMPAAKAHRYLVSFMRMGLVEQDANTGRYDLGEFALELGLASLARLDPVRLAGPVLDDLCERSGETVALAMWGNHGATCVRWVEAGGPVTIRNAYEITSRFDCALGHATCLLGCSENSKGNAAWAITGKT